MKMLNLSFELTARELAVFVAAASNDPTRPIVNGVFFDASLGAVVATDSQVLLAAETLKRPTRSTRRIRSFVLARKPLSLLLERTHASDVLHVAEGQSGATITAYRGVRVLLEEPIPKVYGQFPLWQSVFPGARGRVLYDLGVSPRFVRLGAELVSAVQPTEPVRIHNEREGSPVCYEVLQGDLARWRLVALTKPPRARRPAPPRQAPIRFPFPSPFPPPGQLDAAF